MILSCINVDSKGDIANEDYKIYKLNQIAHQFASKLAEFIIANPECLVRETEDDLIKTTRYEIHVYTPKQLNSLMRDAQRHFMLGLPMVLS